MIWELQWNIQNNSLPFLTARSWKQNFSFHICPRNPFPEIESVTYQDINAGDVKILWGNTFAPNSALGGNICYKKLLKVSFPVSLTRIIWFYESRNIDSTIKFVSHLCQSKRDCNDLGFWPKYDLLGECGGWYWGQWRRGLVFFWRFHYQTEAGIFTICQYL